MPQERKALKASALLVGAITALEAPAAVAAIAIAGIGLAAFEVADKLFKLAESAAEVWSSFAGEVARNQAYKFWPKEAGWYGHQAAITPVTDQFKTTVKSMETWDLPITNDEESEVFIFDSE